MRRLMTLLIIVGLSLVATSVFSDPTYKIFPNCIRGNVDDDSIVTLRDIEKIEKYILGLEPLRCHQVMHADANLDRQVDDHDVELLLSDLGQLPSELTWGDLDANGIADEYDFLLLQQYVSSNGSIDIPSIVFETGDISGDGLVDQLDIDIFLDCESGILASPFSQSMAF